MNRSHIAAPLLLAMCGIASADPSTIGLHASRDAQRLADCTLALNAECVIELSDAKIYAQLSSPNFTFADAERRYFIALKGSHSGWTKFEVFAPSKEFRGNGNVYVFVPYASTFSSGGRTVDTKSYLIGVSVDEGESWKFADGRCFTPKIIKRIIPSYDYDPWPPGSRDAKLAREASYDCPESPQK